MAIGESQVSWSKMEKSVRVLETKFHWHVKLDIYPGGLLYLFESAFLQGLLHWIHDVYHPRSFQPLKQHE